MRITRREAKQNKWSRIVAIFCIFMSRCLLHVCAFSHFVSYTAPITAILPRYLFHRLLYYLLHYYYCLSTIFAGFFAAVFTALLQYLLHFTWFLLHCSLLFPCCTLFSVFHAYLLLYFQRFAALFSWLVPAVFLRVGQCPWWRFGAHGLFVFTKITSSVRCAVAAK